MMGALREWLTSLVTVTLLLSVVQTLLPEGNLRKIGAFTGGLVLLAALLQPVLKTDLEELRLEFDDYEAAVAQRQAELTAAGDRELTALIETRTAAYISDKAEGLGLPVSVQVSAEKNEEGVPVPVSAEVTGPYSGALAVWIEEELGIPTERQVWHEGKN